MTDGSSDGPPDGPPDSPSDGSGDGVRGGSSGAAPGPWSARALRLRRVVNVVNLATPLGLLVARTGRARIEPGPYGLLLARDYRSPVPAPRAPAVTIGDVVLLRLDDERLARRPGLLLHEARHAWQYAAWLGPLGFVPAYLLASAWSWLRTRDFAIANRFEVGAGLADGGYHRRAASSDPPEDRRDPPY